MKVSEIKVNDLVEYCRIDSTDLTDKEKQNFDAYLKVSIEFVKAYTGLKTIEELDKHEDFYIVICVLVEDMYDNRKLYIDKNNLNKIVETILNIHCENLV